MAKAEQYRERADAAFVVADEALTEAGGPDVAEDRATELRARADAAIADGERWTRLAKAAVKEDVAVATEDRLEQANRRMERRAFPAEDRAENAGDIEIPSVDALRRRASAIDQVQIARLSGRTAPEAAQVEASREFEIERDIFYRRIIERSLAPAGLECRAAPMTDQHREAWIEYRKRVFSANTFQGAGEAGAGAEFVPDVLGSQISVDAATIGGLADTSRFMPYYIDSTGSPQGAKDHERGGDPGDVGGRERGGDGQAVQHGRRHVAGRARKHHGAVLGRDVDVRRGEPARRSAQAGSRGVQPERSTISSSRARARASRRG